MTCQPDAHIPCLKQAVTFDCPQPQADCPQPQQDCPQPQEDCPQPQATRKRF